MEVLELIQNLCRLHACRQMQQWNCVMDYLQVHGHETTSTERQKFRFHFEILDISKIFVSYIVLILDSAAQLGTGGRKAGLPHQHMCIK